MKLPREQRVAVSMIAGDGWREEEIKSLLESLEPHCAEMFVNWNGEGPVPPWNYWTSMPIHFQTTMWEDDFAKARDFAYRMIPKDEFGWWLWIDTDDVLVAPEGFAPLLEDRDPYTMGFILRYAYGVEPETGTVVVEQWRERLMSLDWVWGWRWPIHEVCQGPLGTQVVRADGPLSEKVYIRHQRTSGEDRGAKDRNRRILVKAMKEEPESSRFAYYYANEIYREAEKLEPGGIQRMVTCDAGIQAYRKFLSLKPVGDDAYGAAVHLADLFFMKGDYLGALDAYLQAARSYPNWAGAWVGCARTCLQMGDYYRMQGFANIAAGLPKPITSAAILPMDYGFTPLFLRAIANEELGNIADALSDYKAAQALYNDPGQKLDARIERLEERLGQPAAASPTLERLRLRGTRPEKSICFYTNPIHETWNQKTLAEGGHGGSETLVLEMSKRFAADGWRVAVFGCPGDQEGLHDGVEYWKSETWLANEPFTVFISSRAIQTFASPLASKYRFLWMHDVNTGPQLRHIADRPTAIVPISKWHAKHLTKIYGLPAGMMHIVPNGVDLSLYPAREFSDGHRFFWSSSPDRGLENLVSMWPMIRERWPDATLDVYYGWEFIDKIIRTSPNHPLVGTKYRIMTTWDQLGGEEVGLFWRGRVSPTELAAAQQECDIWCYPTGFMETFCLTAVQAQLSGCIPFVSNLAALSETVAFSQLRLEGWPANADFQSRLLQTMEYVLDPEEKGLRETMRRIGREHAEGFGLDASYSAWNNLFMKCGLEV